MGQTLLPCCDRKDTESPKSSPEINRSSPDKKTRNKNPRSPNISALKSHEQSSKMEDLSIATNSINNLNINKGVYNNMDDSIDQITINSVGKNSQLAERDNKNYNQNTNNSKNYLIYHFIILTLKKEVLKRKIVLCK